MKALLIYGGWEGHEPQPVAKLFQRELKKQNVTVTVSDTLESLDKITALRGYDLIIIHWTMGQISDRQQKNLEKAVRGGVGLAGVHGGLGDSMRGSLEYQWMVGGQFVGHPHVGKYEVFLNQPDHPIVDGLPGRFTYESEQYYMLVDPGVNVLASTLYDYDGQCVVHPVVWTKRWGKGRVFYSALGHAAKEFSRYPKVREMTVKGFLWAAGR